MNIYQKLKSLILSLTLFLFPLFFLPFTQEYFITNKFYLLIFTSSLLLLLSGLEIALTGKLKIQLSRFDLLKILFLFAILLSTIIVSPNKIQALLNPNFGFISILSILIFTFYLSKSSLNILKILTLSTIILSLITIIVYFRPFENSYLPNQLQFLRNHYLSPLGTQTDLLVFLVFMFVSQLIQLILLFKTRSSSISSYYFIFTTILTLGALAISLSNIYSGGSETVMPFKYAWLSFTETLKNPFHALFGIGIDNLAAAFTGARDIPYNHSSLWQIRSFDLSTSSLLHVATESGFLGLGILISIIYSALKYALKEGKAILTLLTTLVLIILFSPPSLVVFFIFFLGLTSMEDQKKVKSLFDLNLKNKALSLAFAYILILTLIFFGYVFYRSYSAEFFFKKSIDSLGRNNGQDLYENQRQTILANPFIERYHLNFARTNLLLAEALTKQKKQNESKQAQKIALVEAQLVTRLNPQKATNWENLAVIAKNLTDVITDAEAVSIAAYEKAIVLDPNNPQYRFNLGSIYYLQGNLDEAVRSFEQAVALKIDWPNAHYNLAWALYRSKKNNKAIRELEAAIFLLDPKKDKEDLTQAREDLETFKLAIDGQVSDIESKSIPTKQLNLPQPKLATPEIKLNLGNTDILPSATSEPDL